MNARLIKSLALLVAATAALSANVAFARGADDTGTDTRREDRRADRRAS
ncbi:MAG: hypothetical protein U1E86_21405 [Burkholderiaceae bacterium]